MDIDVIYNENCIEVLKRLEDNSVDAIVTDPPYGLEFMGKEWDKLWDKRKGTSRSKLKGTGNIRNAPIYRAGIQAQEWHKRWATECLRVIKPGGNLLSFGGTRTYHRMVCAIEDAGFEIRDCIMWVYGSGFPKSLNIGKAVQKQQGIKLSDTGIVSPISRPNVTEDLYKSGKVGKNFTYKNVTTLEAKLWEGYGTGLKPAYEPIVLAMKPLDGTFAENCLKWGVGGLNIEATRISAKSSYRGDDNNESRDPSHILSQLYDILCTLEPFSRVVNTDLLRLPSDILHVRKAYAELGSQFYCLVCRGLYDALLPIFQEGVQDVLPLLPVVLSDIDHLRKERNDSPCYLNIDHLSNLDAVHAIISSYLNYTTPHIKSQARFPANFIHDGSQEVMELFPEAGNRWKRNYGEKNYKGRQYKGGSFGGGGYLGNSTYSDSGSAARFFYCAKASRKERDAGLEDMPKSAGIRSNAPRENEEIKTKPTRNSHPTVKPLALMEYLVKLVTRPGHVVLDPFIGSGTTAMACVKLGRHYIGCELDKGYYDIAVKRLEATKQ